MQFWEHQAPGSLKMLDPRAELGDYRVTVAGWSFPQVPPCWTNMCLMCLIMISSFQLGGINNRAMNNSDPAQLMVRTHVASLQPPSVCRSACLGRCVRVCACLFARVIYNVGAAHESATRRRISLQTDGVTSKQQRQRARSHSCRRLLIPSCYHVWFTQHSCSL